MDSSLEDRIAAVCPGTAVCVRRSGGEIHPGVALACP
jgi:hypothetical protein